MKVDNRRYTNDCVLAFGDTHAPYHHRDTLKFLKEVKDFYNPDRVIHLGDILDMYSVSSYPKDVDHPDTWTAELKSGIKFVKKLAVLFPKLDVMESNHDDRVYKKSRLSGIPREVLIKYSELIGAPAGWKWHRELRLTVDSTRSSLYFAHHKTGGSVALAKDNGCTSVLGHSHSKFGIRGISNTKGKVFYAVDSGCLISDKGSPFSYNKLDRGRPINGCVVIQEGVPILIPMHSA